MWKKHNTDISYWARTPAPPREHIQTYEDYTATVKGAGTG